MAPRVDTIDAGTLAVDYGFALAVLNSNSELKRIFKQAVKETWSTDKFVAELRGTRWFQHTSDTARQWLILKASDSQTAKQRTAARTATLRTLAAQMGTTLSARQLADLTNNTLMFGWNEDQVRGVLGKTFKYSPTTATAGLAGTTVNALKQTAADYLVPLSDQAINSWTQRVISGTATADDFKNYAMQQAKSLFPTMAKDIDKGMTVAEYADPYKQSAVQLLGINPGDVDFRDPKWREAIDKVDPKTGDRTVMSLADWQTQVRTDSRYGYDKTATARQSASQLTDSLAKMFGFEG